MLIEPHRFHGPLGRLPMNGWSPQIETLQIRRRVT